MLSWWDGEIAVRIGLYAPKLLSTKIRNLFIGSSMATIHRVRISGCNQTPCDFVVGQTYRMEVDATSCELNRLFCGKGLCWHSRISFLIDAVANSNNLPFAMTTVFLGLPITLIDGNACNHFTVGSCPALNGNHFTFSLDYTATNLLPPVRDSLI